MQDMKLGAVESRFADIIWENAPISSGMLVKLCQEELSWKKVSLLLDSLGYPGADQLK